MNTDEERILALLFVNLGGKKKKRHDWIFIAKNCKKLSDYYGSYKKVADKVGRSPELIRSILKLLELPKDVQNLIKDRKILLDVGEAISTINKEKRQIEIAKAVVGLNAHDARALIRYAKANESATLNDYRKKIMKSKRKSESINFVLVSINDNNYKNLKRVAIKKGITPQKLIAEIVDSWVTKGEE